MKLPFRPKTFSEKLFIFESGTKTSFWIKSPRMYVAKTLSVSTFIHNLKLWKK
jgi:hypothetical protein